MEAEKKAKVDAARTGLEAIPQKSRDQLRKWFEENLALGHRNLGKILLGRKLKGEDEEG